MGVSKIDGKTPKWMVKIMENPPKKNHDLGGKPPIFGNTHIYIYNIYVYIYMLFNTTILYYTRVVIMQLYNKCEPHKKSPLNFHFTGGLIGILIRVYFNPYITG